MKSKCSFILKASISLILALLMLFGTVATSFAAVVDDIAVTGADADVATTGAQYNRNWGGTVYFRVPDKWDLSTYSTVYCVIRRSATSTTTAYSTFVKMSVVGSTSYSRLYKVDLSLDHSNWNQNEWIAFSASSDSTYGSWDTTANGGGGGPYTQGLDYGTDSGSYYLFYPNTTASATTTTTNNPISGYYNATEANVMKYNTGSHSAYAYTNGSSSSTGGTTSIKSYYVNGTTPTESTNTDEPTATYSSAMSGALTTFTASAKTGYTFDGWYSNSNLTTSVSTSASYTFYTYSNGTAATPNKTLYAKFTSKTTPLRFNANGATNNGTLPSNDSLTATYGSAMPTMSPYTAPTKTGYTLEGWYSATSGGTKYYNANGTSATSWAENTTSAKTLYAHWTEVTGGVKVSAYTDSNESSTGGKVKNGTGGTAQGSFNITVGISTKATVVSADPTSGYTFEGWETGGTNASHVKIYTDSNCSTPYVKSTHGAMTTVYVKTDGASGLTTSNAEVHALFESAKYTITNNGAYYKNGAAAYASGTTGGTFTVSQTGSLNYNTNLTLTATAASGYAVEGIYWSNNGGSTWTKVTTTNTTSNGIVTASTNNTFKVTDNFTLKAHFIEVYKLSAFDSYEKPDSTVYFVTAPPKSIVIKHTDSTSTVTTYTYTYDGTKAAGNPDSPDGTKPAALPIATGTYGQGNYIQFYAGDEITMTYSAMATSELLKGVFYNNSENFYTAKPSSAQFIAHTHPSTPAIYMNSTYYTSAQINNRTFTGVTVDQDTHSVKFTGTQDYKNIDVEIGTKRKIYFSDYTNTVIHSKNTDDYYNDNEALSVTGDQLTVKAKQSSIQTNSITATSVKFYKANPDGTKGTELTAEEKTALGLSITGATSTSTSSADGAALVFNGNMPAYDLYIDLNMTNSYTLKLGTKIVSDLGGSATRLASKATVKINTLSAVTNADVTTSTTSVATGATASLSVTSLTSGYMFVGWYWGSDTAPDYEKGFISDKLTLSYAPRKGGTIWAVGTKDLFINGSKYITGKSTDWYSENGSWKNQKMKFDPDRGTQGSYYWEITDTMFSSAGNDFKYTSSNSGDTGGSNTEGKYFKGDDNVWYWCNNEDSKHGKAFFQFLDTETGYDSREVWKGIYSFNENADGTTHGKIMKRDQNQAGDTEYQRLNGQGFIDFAESRYSGYSSPLRIYLDAATRDLDVEATPIYSNLYVSNGYNVGSTLKTDNTTVTVPTGATSFTISTEGSGWTQLNHEGKVMHYIPKKKGATVRITKETRGGDKVAAFLVYDIDNKTVHAEKNITKGTTANSKTPYYVDLTLENTRQNLYIVPIIEESGAKVTITFDATQLNRKQWGDIVTAYSWYKTTNAPGLGDYPGQPMIPSDDMSTWTATFAATKGGNELAGITFTNYVDSENNHGHSWLGEPGVLGEVSNHTTGTATGGIINVYNHVDSGTNGEYSRTNYKAQTYDYHEPIALYDRYKNEQTINITFQMKDGNSSLISWRHHEFAPENIISGTWGSTLNWEYLTNAKGDQYIDMNGNPLGANKKPSATFYVAAKGQVVYESSKMNYVFHGGHDYEMKGYTGTYSNGSYSRAALSQWSSDITYGGVSGLDMKYAVQWYVYDASGNYITTVLSAGIADLSSNNVDTFIGKQLEDMGYAVDGKSVAICYDKPRYMYGDWTITNSANNINSGPDFNAYRFEGQWIAAAQTDTVKINVEVAMMTDSGEVLAHSNTAGYGNASASLVDGVTFTKTQYATTGGSGAWAQTAAVDAKLNGIELNASSQNFIGWYYYDANTGEFTKATYTKNEDFRPNYTNKDVTYYAVYRASAIYQYIYNGREGSRTYSASGEDLTAAEMANNSKIDPASHETDIKNKLPVGIGVFKKNIDFSTSNYSNWTKTPNNDGYILDITGFTTTSPTYTLTAHFKDASGADQTITKTAVYNGTAVDLTAENGGTAVTSVYGTSAHKFLGWYAYDGGVKGDLISTQANYGLRLTRDQAIIAVYAEDSAALPTDGWHVSIDENEVNKELTTSSTGVFYNDTIVRVRNSSDVKATLPSGAKVGVLVVCDNKTNAIINNFTNDQLTTIANAVTAGNTRKLSNGCSVSNLNTNSVTEFNRTDLAVRADYAKTLGAKYCVYAYYYNGSSYTFSEVSAVKTYE